VEPALDQYLQDAALAGMPMVRIIHGKGTGALREAVHKYLNGHSLVSKAVAADTKDGGGGVTVIHMVPVA